MNVYEEVKKFMKRHPLTIAWRLKKNSKVVQEFINPDEEIKYAFAAQKNNRFYDIFSTAVVVLTNKRIIIGRKRVLWGYFVISIMPDMYNDITVSAGLIWGKICIDTIKEVVIMSNLAKSSLDEIETAISTYMIRMKKDYALRQKMATTPTE